MAIPLAATSVTVSRDREPVDYDEYDGPLPLITIEDSVRATISTPSASTTLAGGDRIVYTATMRCDQADIQNGDIVTDNTTGQKWVALNIVAQPFGFGFLIVSLRDTEGAAVL